MNTENPACNYILGPENQNCYLETLYHHTKVDRQTPLEKVDYLIPKTKPKLTNEDATTIFNWKDKICFNDELNKEENDPIISLPFSFLQIRNEKDGEAWYRYYYPHLPEPFYGIIARYYWGDGLTKKALKNERKREEKKEAKKKNGWRGKKFKGLKLIRKPVIIKWN